MARLQAHTMDLQLRGKVVVVTGGSKGIGLACAREFLAEGAKVALISRSAENLASARSALGESVVTEAADMVNPVAAQAAMDSISAKLGAIDILVNSAGAARRYAPNELNAAAWKQTMDAKFFSTVHAIDAVISGMAQRKSGVIINVIGMGGKVASTFHIAGGAANAALMLATAGLAAAYAGQGVRVNGLNPGITMTGRVEEGLKVESRATGIAQEELLKRAQAKIPMGRGALPEEVARVAVFLASPMASYVSGAVVPMDGIASPVI